MCEAEIEERKTEKKPLRKDNRTNVEQNTHTFNWMKRVYYIDGVATFGIYAEISSFANLGICIPNIQPTKNRCTQLHITLYTNWITFSVFYIHNWTWDNIFHSIEPILLLQYCIILVKFAFFTVCYRMWLELSRFFMMFLVVLCFSSFPSLSRTYLYQIVSMWKFFELFYQTSIKEERFDAQFDRH